MAMIARPGVFVAFGVFLHAPTTTELLPEMSNNALNDLERRRNM